MRRPAAKTKPRIASTKSFATLVRGWIANEALSDPQPGGAAVLENFRVTATTVEMRGGNQIKATIGDGIKSVASLFSYVTGTVSKFFGATDAAIYDITTVADPLVSPAAISSGYTGGNWSVVQFQTAGGVFLFGVNGMNNAFLYDGTNFFPISGVPVYRLNYDGQTVNFVVGGTVTGGTSGATGVILRDSDSGASGFLTLTGVTGTFQDNEALTGTPGAAVVNGVVSTLAPAITGLPTASMSFVWAFKRRAFFIEKNTLDAWYLPVDAIGGAAVKLPLGAVFNRGGSLVFGASWSLDTGGGLSEQCVFGTSEGEVAVFDGDNPGDPAAWKKVGVYRIGRPLGPKAMIRGGGDLIVCTDIGFVPLSQAVQRDVAALSPAAVSYPIETEWNVRAKLRSSAPWHAEVWPTEQMVVIALPTVNEARPEMLIANARTGAWSLYTGWDGTCLELFGERLFYGSTAGRVIEAEVGGMDVGLPGGVSRPYTAVAAPLFDGLKNPAAVKEAGIARAVLRAPGEVEALLSAHADYKIELSAPPSAPPDVGSSIWGLGVWGLSTWGSAAVKETTQEWQSVSAIGYALTATVQITSGGIAPPQVELVRIDLTYQVGEP